MLNATLARAYRFHKEYGGWIVGEKAKGALNAARDEAWLEALIEDERATVDIDYDDEPYDQGDSCTDEEAREKFETNEWTGPYSVAVKIEGETVASLHGIVVGQANVNDPYIRVVIAELAGEARYDHERETSEREPCRQPRKVYVT